MDMLGIVLMWFFNVLTSVLKNREGLASFDLSKIDDIISSVDNLVNIFAWVDMFVPVDFLITLALLTTIFYGYKFILSIVKYIISLFK